jgi:hypothetical protein
MWSPKRQMPLKKNRKGALRSSQELATGCKIKCARFQLIWEDSSSMSNVTASQVLRGCCVHVQQSLTMPGAGSRPWHHPVDAGLSHTQSARVVESWRFLPRFQRKPWGTRRLWQGEDLCRLLPRGNVWWCEWAKLQWGPQGAGDARNMEHLLKKARGNEGSQPKRQATWTANWETIGVGLPHPTEFKSWPQVSPLLDMSY